METLVMLLLLAAVVLFVIAAGWKKNLVAWGLACFAGAFLAPHLDRVLFS
jgi:predicted cobalt transporter CbtA